MGTGAILLFPAERKQLAAIRSFVDTQAAYARASAEMIDDLIQAVDEAATNVIVHGYQDGPGEIEIEIRTRNGEIIIYLRDSSPHFDPTIVPDPDIHLPLEKRKPGGLGIYLIRKCVDSFRYRVCPDGRNEIELIKWLDHSR